MVVNYDSLPRQKYTLILRNALYLMGMQDDSNESIKRMIPQVFDDFPIFEESHREELELKILKHFYFYEIGSETWGMFRFRLNQKLQEIMPFYNERYRSLTLEYDPMKPTNITSNATSTSTSEQHENGVQQTTDDGRTTNTQNTTQHEEGTEDGTNNSTNTYWDTPQTELTDQSYATNIRKEEGENHREHNTDGTVSVEGSGTSHNDGTSQNSNDRNGKSDDKSESTTKGNNGIPGQDLLQKYRDVIINVDMEIIYELKPCFMMVY